MKTFEIKSWISGAVLFSLETTSLKLCVEAAVGKKIDLSDADLSGADLSDADLSGAVDIPVATDEQAIANLDKVREIVLDDAKRLEMGRWHDNNEWVDRTCAEEAVCGTTHCLAGWLQVCSTDPRVRKLYAATAGIVQAPIASKMFYRDAPEVLDWLTERKYVADIEERAKRRAARAKQS